MSKAQRRQEGKRSGISGGSLVQTIALNRPTALSRAAAPPSLLLL